MPEFRYKAMDSRSRLQEGVIAAASEAEARQLLRERGLLPMYIKTSPIPLLRQRLKYVSYLDPGILAQFCRQMAMMLQAGVTVVRGLDIMQRQLGHRAMRRELARIHREVQTGRSLADAMLSEDSRIPPLLARMVATGEASGRLDEILRRMAEFYEQEDTTRRRIRGAMVYPAVLLLVSISLLFVVFKFLIPQIQNLLAGTGVQLPLLTRVVMNISRAVMHYWVLILLFMAGIWFLLRLYFATPGGRLYRDRFYSFLPAVGPVVRSIATARFARTAAIVFGSGLPLLQGLELVHQNVGNALAERAVTFAHEGVQRGDALADHLARENFFDPMVIQMVRVGEETGQIEEIMSHIAAHYTQAAHNGIAQLLTLVEPFLILVMGLIVGLVVVSAMLPLFDLITNIKALQAR